MSAEGGVTVAADPVERRCIAVQLLPGNGEHSRIWLFEKGGLRAMMSFDYAFPYWHDLTVCYNSVGWEFSAIDDFRAPLAGGEIDCVRFTMAKPIELLYGSGWFGEFDPNGNPVVKTEMPGIKTDRFETRAAAVRERWLALAGLRPRPPSSPTCCPRRSA